MATHPLDGQSYRKTFGYNQRYSFSWSSPLRWLTGQLHKGVDWAVPSGTPIKAVVKSRIVAYSTKGSYGLHIVLESLDGKWRFRFAHLSTFASATRLDKIWNEGEVFAWSGNTGSSTAPHLHFEILKKVDGQWVTVNPETWLMTPPPEHVPDELDILRGIINQLFRDIFKREPVKEDNDYFLSRIGSSIMNRQKLINVMKYWAIRDGELWEKERRKVLGTNEQ